MQYLSHRTLRAAGLAGLAGTTKKKAPKREALYISAEQVYYIARAIADREAIPARYTPADRVEWSRHAVATAAHESTLNYNAKNSGSTARGLMQILEGTQSAIEKMLGYPSAPDRIYEPAYAILLSMTYLGYQVDRYKGDWSKAVHAYNQGSYPGKSKAAGQAYLKKHLTFYRQYAPYFAAWEANYQRSKQ